MECFDADIDLSPLIEFFTNQIEKTWEHFLDRSSRNSAAEKSLSDIIQACNNKHLKNMSTTTPKDVDKANTTSNEISSDS